MGKPGVHQRKGSTADVSKEWLSRLKPAVNGTEKEIFQKHIKGCIPDIVDGK
jgi:hypothetical protein